MMKAYPWIAALALLPAAALARQDAPAPTAPATAAAPAAPQSPAPKAKLARTDPNRMVCETIDETGSRLSATRVCKTAAQWKQDRENNRNQQDRGCGGGNC